MSGKESTAELVEDFDAPKRKKYNNVFFSVAIFFLLCDLFERFGYYTATGSLTIYFKRELGLDSVLATQMQATFQSICYVVPLVGAYAADSFLGRYKTLLYSFILYVIGGAMITGAAVPGFNNAILFFIGLFVGVACGTGAVKPNLIVMGGDQFDENDPKENKQKSSYFGVFYWCTNVAAFVAFSIMGGLAVQGMGVITPDISFFASFAIGAIFILFAALAFLAGTPRYYIQKPQGSVLPLFFGLVGSAAKRTVAGMAIGIGALCELAGVLITIVSFFYKNPIVSYTAAGLVAVGVILLIVFGRDPSWVDKGAEGRDPQTVDDAKQVVRMMPYVAFIVVFWAVYNQMNTNFITQGCQMYDEAFGIKWSPSQLATFNTVGVLVGVPIADRIVYPLMNKCGAKATPLKRVGIGFGVCVVAMAVSGFVEIARKASSMTDVPSSCGGVNMNSMNVMWQVPQYALVGLAEVFTAITYYDLFYSEVPASMRSVCQAINMLTTSLGTMLGGTINAMTSMWLPDDLNEGHMEYTYFLLAALGLIDLIVFMPVARGFTYAVQVGDEPEESEEEVFEKVSRRGSAVSAR